MKPTLAHLKANNWIFFSKATVKFHGDTSYDIVANETGYYDLRVKENVNGWIVTAMYTIEPKTYKLSYKK